MTPRPPQDQVVIPQLLCPSESPSLINALYKEIPKGLLSMSSKLSRQTDPYKTSPSYLQSVYLLLDCVPQWQEMVLLIFHHRECTWSFTVVKLKNGHQTLMPAASSSEGVLWAASFSSSFSSERISKPCWKEDTTLRPHNHACFYLHKPIRLRFSLQRTNFN